MLLPGFSRHELGMMALVVDMSRSGRCHPTAFV